MREDGSHHDGRLKIGGVGQVETIQVQQVIARDGEVLITGLPYKRGQAVEIVVFLQPTTPLPRARLTVGQLRRSGLIGLWEDRDDMGDSSVYARYLREQVQQHSHPLS